MSANNVIYITNPKKGKNEILYQGCYDNGLDGVEFVGTANSLEEAVRQANEWVDGFEYDEGMPFILEYGIQILTEYDGE